MEESKFHDPETPPPTDSASIRPVFSLNISDETIHQPYNKSDKELNGKADIFDGTTSASDSMRDETKEKEGSISRRSSHTDQALHLVDAMTRQKMKRRPSKAGVLSNLLKLNLFEEKNRRQHGSSSSYYSRHQHPPPRPTYQLRSIASSRALLQTMGASPQSARSSLYFEDLHKAELGIVEDAAVAAHRITIAAEIADILKRQDLIIKMGKSLVRTGAPSHRIVSC
ncbi:uncharacterized protein BX663DRAFT_45872 [Cokeromyces recurvatus]|uniref:uncharacterized protein n=1 Tax=Cokeromyces recurvatus TaxID=90255 RepID=UPI00221ED74F|nr:uncharacterized protein BX663DRAFT_45872 [Cokeromyces recurvatus]KAI7903257.1 hypothetical protein BX663DRAFT_45872 [Cokeromyces recurvatus]